MRLVLVPRSTLKARAIPQLPGAVLGTSPIVATAAGLTYTVSLDLTALKATLDAYYQPAFTLAAGVAAWLAAPSSANLRTAVTDETGTGALVFATSPTFTTGITVNGKAVISNAAIGTLDVQSTSFTQIDGSAWAQALARIGANFSAAGSGAAGSANENGLSIQCNVPAATGAAASYEKVAALFMARSSDPSTGVVFRDIVGCDMRGYITNGNTLGRAWGGTSWAEIQSGGTGDGLLVGHEIDVYNNGTDQASVDTTTSKYGLQCIAYGSADSTAAIQARSGTAKWHKVLFSAPADISAGGKFLELSGIFSVDVSGKTSIANTSSTSGAGGIDATVTQTQPNAGDTSDGAVRALWALTAASATNELIARVFKFQATNNLTGGGAISNLRIVNLTANYNAGTTTSTSFGIYLEAGTVTGTVTTSYGLYIETNWTQGTTKWAIYDAAQLSSYLGGLSLGTTTQAAPGNLLANGSVLSKGATAGVGYATGAGGTVTQATSKSTGATLNTVCGAVTMNGAALAAGTIVSFVLTNSAIAATDVLVLNHISGGTPGSYTLNARAAAGSATIDVRNNTAGSLSEAIVIQFAVIRAVNT